MTQESRVPAIRNETQKLEASGIAGLARGAPDNQTVRKGKTLTQISRRYKLQVKHLHEINEFKGSKLKIGRVSRLKEKGKEKRSWKEI